MTINQLKSDFSTLLQEFYPKNEINSFFYRLCGCNLGLNRVDLALKPNTEVSAKQEIYFLDAVKRLKNKEPIQYIIGKTEFYGLTFKVNEHVLIPRPETEELVSWILKEAVKPQTTNHKLHITNYKSQTTNYRPQQINILDIGTGSGCIAIALAKNLPQAKVWALDVSKEALNIAKQNADLNQVNISFIEADILNYNIKDKVIASKTKLSHPNKEITTVASLLRKDEKFDIIISNPPYVKQDEKKLMQLNVLNHEPHLALFVKDDNPLIFYDKIAYFATNYLNKKGILFFEINQSFGKEVCSILKEKEFTNITLKQDLFEVDRMVKANLK